MNKILFITNRLPFPGTDGRKNMLLQYVRHMKEIYPGSEIVNLSFVDDPKYLSQRPPEIGRLATLTPPGKLEKLYNIVVHSLIRRKWPLQVSVYYSRKTHRKIREFVREEEPDFVLYDMVRVAEYLAPGQGRKVLSYDDLLSLRYRRQLDWFQYIPSVLGGFSDKLPNGLKKFADLKFVQKWLIAFESKMLGKYEKQVAPRFDHLIFTSPAEAQNFRKTTRHESCHGVPMKVDPDFRMQARGSRLYDKNKVVFVGKMDIPHNSSAAVYFCERVWARIKQSNPAAVFYIVGKNPTAEVLRLQRDHPGVIVTGEVDDVKRIVGDSALMIAPLLFGTGIKTKILEAMSWGVPVVTNAIGSEGLDANNGEDLFVCESEDEMVRSVLLLMGDSEINDSISGNSIRYVSRRFSSSATRKNMELILS
ncbi:glycosyltransferase family 4 protein [Cohnella ginsengisoli]|uniref:Glycosyltransferase family 4 protein n=1 Tax=Cohnella ginsengisoli TaxID=425004 RepID=A0A9X4QMZ2_9BACL|nr:glycosyltransferase [Cohnella ginsengisoli]MDG0791465.1 glycosyltransferase family 4 protein [Cohnella ginsengisoli]